MKSPFPKSTYERNAEIYKVLANPKRLEILNIIKEQEVSVDDLIKLMKISKANMSQHLALLKRVGLIQLRRDGLYGYCSIIDPRIVEPCRILHDLFSNTSNSKI